LGKEIINRKRREEIARVEGDLRGFFGRLSIDTGRAQKKETSAKGIPHVGVGMQCEKTREVKEV